MIILRTDKGDFDLFGNEDIVQTLGIFNFDDISARSGEYTNVFNLPLTNNNSKLIEYADYLLSINTAPYQKINCKLIIDGLEFKTGLFIIEEVSDIIKARFISGNSNFYTLIKAIYLTDLDWSAYDHIWNYTNAVASSANTSGYTYPIIDYNGQTLGGDILDVRKVLPATFGKTALAKIFSELGYTVNYNFDTTDLDAVLLPYTNKIPSYSPEYLLLNSLDASTTVSYDSPYSSVVTYSVILGAGWRTYNIPEVYDIRNRFDTFANGSSTFWSNVNKFFTVVAPGVYSYNIFIDLATYATTSTITVTNVNTSQVLHHYWYARYELRLIKFVNGVDTIIDRKVLTSAYTMTGKVQLDIGDNVFFRVVPLGYVDYELAGGFNGSFDVYINNTVLNTNTFTLDLDPELTFGNLITYSSMLPKIKCSDYFRDICIRFGLIPNINEDTKVIDLNRFDTIYDNIPSRLDWSDKIDESTKPVINFKYDSYAQNNKFLHKTDKSILKTDQNANYNLVINNANLELEKDIYNSPFATTENITFKTTLTSYIDLYDTSTGKFDNDVQPRICFSKPLTGLFKFTDGTTTSGYINTRRLWFIDNSLPDLSMGFGFLMPKNSRLLIDTLQNLKLVKADFNLSLIDIKNIDFFTPIYVDSLQSYFFIPAIKQYNYTNPNLTEVELIKLNP